MAARYGIEAKLYWPGLGEVPATELVLRRLLPLARRGLEAWGVEPADRDRLLGIIEQRCVTGRNGATWQVDTVRALEHENHLDRADALREAGGEYGTTTGRPRPTSWPRCPHPRGAAGPATGPCAGCRGRPGCSTTRRP